jgi:hypothetical protein
LETDPAPIEKKEEKGANEGSKAQNFTTIDFYADLIPLLKQKYANTHVKGPVEAICASDIPTQNLLVENTQSHGENRKVSPISANDKSE